MKMSIRGIALFLGGLLLAGLLSGCADAAGTQDVPEPEYVAVGRGPLASSISAIGSVHPAAEALLSFQSAGRVREVLVEPGDRVEQGQAIARLDSTDVELQLRGAEAGLAAAQAQLAQLQAGPRPEEVAVAQGQVAAAQAALEQAVAQRDQLVGGATEAEIAAARAAVTSARANQDRVKAGPTTEELAAAQATLDSARAAVEQAQADYDRVKGRADVRALPESLALQAATIEMQRAQASYDAVVNRPTASELAAAAAQLAQAEAQLAALEAGVAPQLRVAEAAVAAAQAQRDIAQAQLDLLLAGATAAQLAAADAQVEQAQVALDTARLAREEAVLRAPVAGVVDRVDVDLGESVGPQTPVVTLVGDSQFRIEADVDEADIGWIESGQDVVITFDAFSGQTLAGKVAAVASLANVDTGVVSYRVTIQSDPVDLPVRAGMTANVQIVKDQKEDALLVPNLAISVDANSGRKFVMKKTPAGVEQAEIVTGLTTDLFSEVTSGLQEGDLVVVDSLSAREQFRQMMGSSLMGGGGKQ